MKFDVLGALKVTDDDGAMLPVRRPLIRSAITVMVLHRNQPVRPARLVDLLWGPSDGDTLHSLRSCVWGIRQVLPPGRLVTDDLGYRLRVDPGDEVDLDRFRQLHRDGYAAVARGEPDIAAPFLGEAVALWRYPELESVLPATPAMASLLVGLEQERRDAHDALIQARLDMGGHRELLPELRTLVAQEPLDERLRAHLMLALYRHGLKTEALGVFDDAEAALPAGAGPGSELQNLRDRIQADDPMLIVPVRS